MNRKLIVYNGVINPKLSTKMFRPLLSIEVDGEKKDIKILSSLGGQISFSFLGEDTIYTFEGDTLKEIQDISSLSGKNSKMSVFYKDKDDNEESRELVLEHLSGSSFVFSKVSDEKVFILKADSSRPEDNSKAFADQIVINSPSCVYIGLDVEANDCVSVKNNVGTVYNVHVRSGKIRADEGQGTKWHDHRGTDDRKVV